MHETSERYDLNKDRWVNYPNLNVGRSFHSSCSFEGRFIFVLCGLVIETRQLEITSEEDRGQTIIKEEIRWKVSNSIERLDAPNKSTGWIQIKIDDKNPLTARRNPGVLQINSEQILIFGGSSDKPLRAMYYFSVQSNSIRRETAQNNQPSICPRHRPVVFGVNSRLVTGESDEPHIYEDLGKVNSPENS